MTMDIGEVADGWYWSHRHREGDNHGGYLATGRRAVWIDDDNRDLSVGLTRLETVC